MAKSHKDQEDTGKDRGDHKTVKPVFCNDSGNNGCKAVGPAICTLLPPKAEITKPATIAVKIPACGPTPEASAKAMDNGRAMIATMIPAVTSLTNCDRS